MGFEIESIGIIHTPFKRQKDIPIQPEAAAGSKGRVEVYPQFIDGLKDLEHFGRIWLIYYFHQFPMVKMTVTPSMDSEPRGVFATRASCRPSRIGMSNVRLLGIEQNILSVEEIDVLDGTPLLDIKPYVPQFDLFDVKNRMAEG